jgi:type VI secretion system protein ImpA
MDLTTANAAFRDCADEDLHRTASAVSSALENLRRIGILVTEKIGASNSPDLAPLADLLTEANALLGKLLDDRSQVAEPESGGPREQSDETSPAPGSGRRATSAQAGGAINSREDVIGMLDRLCEYYAHNEPSSPVPLLLHRARRLVPKDFIDIVRDIAPGALPQVEAIRGTEDDS